MSGLGHAHVSPGHKAEGAGIARDSRPSSPVHMPAPRRATPSPRHVLPAQPLPGTTASSQSPPELEREASRIAAELSERTRPDAGDGSEPADGADRPPRPIARAATTGAAGAHLSSPGSPLDAATRESMELALPFDFSSVRLHADADASDSARALHALSYTVGEHIFFGAGRPDFGSPNGRSILLHELTHVVQQRAIGQMVQRLEDPASLSHTVDPTRLSDGELDREIDLLTAWLATNQGAPDAKRLAGILGGLQVERQRRSQAAAPGATAATPPAPVTPAAPTAPARQPMPPPTAPATAAPQTVPAPTTTQAEPSIEPSGGVIANLTPDPATEQRLMNIARNGGPIPEGTRVIGAAVVKVQGFLGKTEIRAISAAETDGLGIGAPVFHATTPSLRTLSAVRSIGGASIRREFPFSHINDAEIKILEYIRANLPPNATGEIQLITVRSREGGKIIEPYPACSGCTQAFFQATPAGGRLRLGTYAPAHPTGSVELGATPGAKASTQAAAQEEASRPGIRAEIGTPSTAGLWVGGPSPKGVAIGGAIQLALMVIDFVAKLALQSREQRRLQEELARLEPMINERRQANPEFGALLVMFFDQPGAPPDSILQPGPTFSHIEIGCGRTPSEARLDWQSRPSLHDANMHQEFWVPPATAASVFNLQKPFPPIAMGRFAPGRSILQLVRWGGTEGFDDVWQTRIGDGARFLILGFPSSVQVAMGAADVRVDIPIVQRSAASGGSIPVVDLDPWLPTNATGACLFPADDATDRLFANTRATEDNLGQLRMYTNFDKVRWARPENIELTALREAGS